MRSSVPAALFRTRPVALPSCASTVPKANKTRAPDRTSRPGTPDKDVSVTDRPLSGAPGSDAREHDGGLAVAVVDSDHRVVPGGDGGDLEPLLRLWNGLEAGRQDLDGVALGRSTDDVVLEVQVAHVDVAQLDAERFVALP